MRRYTRQELDRLDTTTLKAICKELKIKSEMINFYDDKALMIQLIYKYRGMMSDRYINEWDEEKINRLEKAIKEKGENIEKHRIEIPAYFSVYKGIDSLAHRGSEHKVYSEADLDMTSALLTDSNGEIKAVIDVIKGNKKNNYILRLKEHMLSGRAIPGVYKNYKIVFFSVDFEKVLRIYNSPEENPTRIRYSEKTIQEVQIEEIEETDDVLVIDYGTSYTTAGTYAEDKIKHVMFYSDEKCEYSSEAATRLADCRECGRCALCPSVIAVKECCGDEVTLLFGHDAKNRVPIAKNSIFFDTKRWVNDYSQAIDVKDLDGNTSTIKKSKIIEGFMKFVIHTAEQQNKVKYKNICFTSPVKQKAMSLSMYRDILRDYCVEERGAIDEAVAVVYDSMTNLIKTLEYDDGYERSVLLIDCGGSTSDMVKCDFSITNRKKRSDVFMRIGYANGDTNFGGNNLTYRVMQYLKIKMAQYYSKEKVNISGLLTISRHDIFDYIDNYGIKKTYEPLEQAYQKAGALIPTNFADYINDTESVFFSVKGNFYFLWELAERIKTDLYSNPANYEFSFDQLRDKKNLFMLSIRNEKETFTTHTEPPPIRIVRDEINLLIKPEIYNLLKKFIEPFYKEDETMSGIDAIMLSGQTTKIDLFMDVLKEYIAGHKTRAPFEHSYSKKLKCIRGAVAYHAAKSIGRIRPKIIHDPAVIPYFLTVETFDGSREKTLIEQGQLLSNVYSFVDRTYETKIIVYTLRDHDREVLQTLKFNLETSEYMKTDYQELLQKYAWLRQGDIDRIDDGEVRLFIYSDDESWGFKWLGVANCDGYLHYGKERFVPFENTAWELNFFDGKR